MLLSIIEPHTENSNNNKKALTWINKVKWIGCIGKNIRERKQENIYRTPENATEEKNWRGMTSTKEVHENFKKKKVLLWQIFWEHSNQIQN